MFNKVLTYLLTYLPVDTVTTEVRELHASVKDEKIFPFSVTLCKGRL